MSGSGPLIGRTLRAGLILWVSSMALGVVNAESVLPQSAASSAQASDASEAPLSDIALEQRGIDARRAREMARLDAADAACYQRFAVNDCLAQVQAQRRAELAELRRRQTVLDAATRLQRSQHALQERERKLAQQASDEAALAEGAAQAQVEAQERSAMQKNKVAAHRAIASSASVRPLVSAPAGLTDAERALNRAAYEKRQAEQDAHRRDVEKHLQEQPQRPALPSSAAASVPAR